MTHAAITAPLAPLVLVAADDDEMRTLLGRALRRDGYEVQVAADGAELARVLADARRMGRDPDLIVSDVRMPQIGGLELVAALRAAGCTTRVILVSAFADAATMGRPQELGVSHVLSKPFELDDLRTVAMHLLDR